jgi:hypothetical protein
LSTLHLGWNSLEPKKKTLLNKFWKENSARIILELTNQKLPELQFSFKEKEGKTTLEKKVRALPSEIRLIYTTNDFEKIRKDIESKGKKLRIERFLKDSNYYAIRNLLHEKKTLFVSKKKDEVYCIDVWN